MAAIVAGIVGFGVLSLMGIHTDTSSTPGTHGYRRCRADIVSAIFRLRVPEYSLLRFSARIRDDDAPLLTRLRVPASVVNILAASSTPTADGAAIMVSNTPDQTEEA